MDDRERPLPLPAAVWAQTPPAAQTLILALGAEVATLRAEVATLAARVRELEARLGQTSQNSSRPPSSDPPGTPRPPKPRPSGRRRGGQAGHRGRHRALLPSERVDRLVVMPPPAQCRHCQQPFAPEHPVERQRQRHQVVELPPLAALVTEYQLLARRCPHCQQVSRAALPAGVSGRPFGPRLTATVALLTGRYRLSRREAQRLLRELWGVELGLGTVVGLEQAQSAALGPVVAALEAALPAQPSVSMDETSWREGTKRAWLWVAVAPGFTVGRIAPSRGAREVRALLGEGYQGVVGCDRWSAYRRQRRALCHSHLKRAFQGLAERGGAAEPIGRWGVAEEARLFALWRRFQAGELDRAALRRRLVPIRARFGRLLWRGEACGDAKAQALCRDLNASWDALWTFAVRRLRGGNRAEPEPTRSLRAHRCGQSCPSGHVRLLLCDAAQTPSLPFACRRPAASADVHLQFRHRPRPG